jgi:hypothetical protein
MQHQVEGRVSLDITMVMQLTNENGEHFTPETIKYSISDSSFEISFGINASFNAANNRQTVLVGLDPQTLTHGELAVDAASFKAFINTAITSTNQLSWYNALECTWSGSAHLLLVCTKDVDTEFGVSIPSIGNLYAKAAGSVVFSAGTDHSGQKRALNELHTVLASLASKSIFDLLLDNPDTIVDMAEGMLDLMMSKFVGKDSKLAKVQIPVIGGS